LKCRRGYRDIAYKEDGNGGTGSSQTAKFKFCIGREGSKQRLDLFGGGINGSGCRIDGAGVDWEREGVGGRRASEEDAPEWISLNDIHSGRGTITKNAKRICHIYNEVE
jgi:hypothetical protein